MSSRELLELFGASIIAAPDDEESAFIKVEWAPENGAVAAMLRDGERCEWQQMLAQSANELAVLRAVQAPDAQSDEYDSRLFLSPARQREIADKYRRRTSFKSEPGSLYSTWNK